MLVPRVAPRVRKWKEVVHAGTVRSPKTETQPRPDMRQGGAVSKPLVKHCPCPSHSNEPRSARGRRWRRCRHRPQHGLERQRMGRPRRRLRALVKDELLDRLQLGDCARHLLLAGCELVDAARYLLLAGSKGGGGSVDALTHRVEIERYGVEQLIVGRGGWRDHAS